MTRTTHESPCVLLIAQPGAGRETISAPTDAGAMPASARLIERETFGKMTAAAPDGAAPALVPANTGLRPHHHRLLTEVGETGAPVSARRRGGSG